MNDMEEYLKRILRLVDNPNNESLRFSMRNVHARGIFSLVIDGDEPGKLTRVFISNRKLKPFQVQLHTHRYPVTISILKGNITHHTAESAKLMDDRNKVWISQYKYRSVLNGGTGLEYVGMVSKELKEYKLPIGSKIDLETYEYHTMSCSKGSIWVVEEKGFERDYSMVLGVPFVTDNLYNEPAMFQVVDNCQKVSRTIKNLLLQYELTKTIPNVTGKEDNKE